MPHAHALSPSSASPSTRSSKRTGELSHATKRSIAVDPIDSAKMAGLRYVTGGGPGIRRKRAGTAFSYTGLDGKPIHAPKELARIKSLGIPPA